MVKSPTMVIPWPVKLPPGPPNHTCRRGCRGRTTRGRRRCHRRSRPRQVAARDGAGERGVAATHLVEPQLVGGGAGCVPEDVLAPVAVEVADVGREGAGHDARRAENPLPDQFHRESGMPSAVPEQLLVAVAVAVEQERQPSGPDRQRAEREAVAGRAHQVRGAGRPVVDDDVVVAVPVDVTGQHVVVGTQDRDGRGGEGAGPLADPQQVGREPGPYQSTSSLPSPFASSAMAGWGSPPRPAALTPGGGTGRTRPARW